MAHSSKQRHRTENEPCIPWDLFGGPGCSQMKSIRKQWKTLLKKEGLHERYYHDFIARHAHTFFPMLGNVLQVISKVRLGAELVTDIVIVRDESSLGLSYQLIEIETPWVRPFTKDGIASARLTRAIHQILDWKRWLEQHKSEARRLFPSLLHLTDERPLFRYCIVIGARQNSRSWLHKRNHLSETLGINIRSFDWLTDCLMSRSAAHSFADEYHGGGAEEDSLPRRTKNALANPFVRAMSDPEWRKFIVGQFGYSHMVGHHADRLLAFRRTNSHEARFFKTHGLKKTLKSEGKG